MSSLFLWGGVRSASVLPHWRRQWQQQQREKQQQHFITLLMAAKALSVLLYSSLPGSQRWQIACKKTVKHPLKKSFQDNGKSNRQLSCTTEQQSCALHFQSFSNVLRSKANLKIIYNWWKVLRWFDEHKSLTCRQILSDAHITQQWVLTFTSNGRRVILCIGRTRKDCSVKPCAFLFDWSFATASTKRTLFLWQRQK